MDRIVREEIEAIREGGFSEEEVLIGEALHDREPLHTDADEQRHRIEHVPRHDLRPFARLLQGLAREGRGEVIEGQVDAAARAYLLPDRMVRIEVGPARERVDAAVSEASYFPKNARMESTMYSFSAFFSSGKTGMARLVSAASSATLQSPGL